MRMIDISHRAFDWAAFHKPPRPAMDRTIHCRVLTLGFDVRWNDSARVYSISAGLRYLLNIDIGWYPLTFEWGEGRKDRTRRYLSLTLLGMSFDIGKTTGDMFDLRGFWRGRRIYTTKKAR
jgi:hypothetical protein